ncbi:hypothetical protein F1C58_14340 [Glaciihabitans sp. INWT7]|uniref:hypothetical protein n=1 Tax=Glaciihabitans sp. INWT7 TaxID=2596912 RepID=UPI0016291D64|nr:hypothetical protein [Glaciihabitans sp. INWT7]QNE47960.1 hypothetical protein F1C58_14340 [Glaciihabitans sp. INWT7]
MSTDTPVRSVTAPDAGYSIVFPGTWSVIPLDADEIMKTVIGRIVKKQVGVADRLARTRRMMIEELLTTAQRARDAGAHTMHLSLEILPGVPFPAALIASDSPWPKESIPAAPAAFAESLAATFPGVSIVGHRFGPMCRTVEAGLGRFGDAETPSLSAEYRLPYPDGGGVLTLTISAPMARDPELYATLFDAMVDSLTWKA